MIKLTQLYKEIKVQGRVSLEKLFQLLDEKFKEETTDNTTSLISGLYSEDDMQKLGDVLEKVGIITKEINVDQGIYELKNGTQIHIIGGSVVDGPTEYLFIINSKKEPFYEMINTLDTNQISNLYFTLNNVKKIIKQPRRR